jgi:uncharacterized protein involved in response to NO
MGAPRFTGTTTVDDVIRIDASLNRVLSAYGVDTCCGGALTLAEVAEAHGVPLPDILAALNAPAAPSVAAPQSPPVQSAARLPSPTRYLRFFVASLSFALTFGAALGACMLGSMTLPWNLLHGLPLTAVKTAHAYAQVYGFATLFIMGVAYHVIPRFTGAPLSAPRLAAASFWLQVGGVLAVAVGTLAGVPISGPAQIAGTVGLLGAALALGWNIDRSFAASTMTREPYESYLRAGCAWLVVATVLGIATAATGKTTLQSVMWESALWGFLGSWLFGMSLRILPVFMGVAPVRPRAAKTLFLGYELAVAAWVTVACIEAWTPLLIARAFAGAALVVTAVALVLQIGVLGPRERGAADDGGYTKFIVAAYAWLLLALLFAPAWSAVAALGGAGAPALLFDFGRHAFTLGFLTQMIIGVATRIVPVFTGAPLWSPKARDATFGLLNAAVATRALQVVVELAGSEAAWPYISLSGVFGLAAFIAFALNVFMTIRSRTAVPARAPAPAAGTTPSADHLIADLLTIAGALELLVARGFRPLSNPAMRAAMAGTVTLRQACRIHGVDVEPLIAELRTLATAKRAA